MYWNKCNTTYSKVFLLIISFQGWFGVRFTVAIVFMNGLCRFTIQASADTSVLYFYFFISFQQEERYYKYLVVSTMKGKDEVGRSLRNTKLRVADSCNMFWLTLIQDCWTSAVKNPQLGHRR